jgi:hypothetical protein
MRIVLSRVVGAMGTTSRAVVVQHRFGVAAPRVAKLHATRVVYKGRRTGSKAHL